MVRYIGNVQKDAQVRAVASGALANGDTVIVNADGTVSVVSVSVPVVFDASQSYNMDATFDSNSNKVVIAYRDDGNSNYGTAIVGTVDASDNSISFGTPVVYNSGYTTYSAATFDSSSNKIVIAYSDNGNNNYGTAVVGTVSGTSISFGSEVVFKSSDAVAHIASTFDSSSNKVVIAYARAPGEVGYAIVGTVSGTSISFGSETNFRPTANSTDISIVYDVNSGKVVIVYTDQGNSQYGTAVVGTVSGTAISFGTPVIYNSGSSLYNSIVYDSNAQKVVIAYRNVGNSSYGTAIVGTVSGTSISFGTAAVFESATSDFPTTTFDSNSNKVVIAYRDVGNSNYGTFVKGTVSGTSISFDTPSVFNAGTTGSNDGITSVFDSNLNRNVIAYNDSGDGIKGKAIVFQNSLTNFTSENFIGFADGAYADTQSAVINTTCSVDRNQTSLTAGQKYYVQTNGSLGTTAADPSVEAGTAISATEILVKG